MNKYLFMAIIVLGTALIATWYNAAIYEEKYKVAEANVKAYSNELSGAKDKNTALRLTIDQLKYFSDSILVDLDNTRKELKIKDKNLKALQAISSGFTKRDTITLRDTLFRDPSIAIDTVIGDKWYNVRLGLKYPSMVAVKPYFKSEKHIIVSSKKETVDPPKKFFLFRWFQRKHTVLHIDVVEKNPYVENESSRYVEILK